MKNQIKISLLSLILLLAGSGYSQSENAISTPEFRRDMTLKEQLAVLKAGQNNPTRPETVAVEPRVKIEMQKNGDDPAMVNNRASSNIEMVIEPELPRIQDVSNEATNKVPEIISTGTQPMGQKSETTMEYGKAGGSEAQSLPEVSGNTFNYKSVKGIDHQPAGKTPEK